MKLKKVIAFSLLILTAGLPSAVFASEIFKASPWVKEEPYIEKISHKLGFGALNFLTGWTAFFFEPGKEGNKLKGLMRGIIYTVTDTAGGALQAVTFPIPFDIPLPGGGISYE